MAFNIRITHIPEHSTAGEAHAKADRPMRKRAAAAKTSAFIQTLVNVPDVNVINKYPVRIFNVES